MEDLSLHILDVAENGIRAGATLINILVDENLEDDLLTIVIKDNGKGMSTEFLNNVLEAEGNLEVQSTPGVGTKVTVTMRNSHIDRKPMGDMVSTVLALIEGNPNVDVVYDHRRGHGEYVLDTREIRAELGDIPMNFPQVVSLLQCNLSEGLKELNVIS